MGQTLIPVLQVSQQMHNDLPVNPECDSGARAHTYCSYLVSTMGAATILNFSVGELDGHFDGWTDG